MTVQVTVDAMQLDATSDAGVPEAEVAAYRDEPLSFSVGEGETVTSLVTSTSVLGRASQKVLAPLARLRSLTPACPVQVRSPVWGLGTGPAAVHWPLDEHPQILGTLSTTHNDLLIAVEFGVWYPL